MNESHSTEVLMPGQRQTGTNISGNADTVSPDTRSSEARDNESPVQDTRYSEAPGRDQVPSPLTSSGSSRTKEDHLFSIAMATNEEVIAARDSIGSTYESLEKSLLLMKPRQ